MRVIFFALFLVFFLTSGCEEKGVLQEFDAVYLVEAKVDGRVFLLEQGQRAGVTHLVYAGSVSEPAQGLDSYYADLIDELILALSDAGLSVLSEDSGAVFGDDDLSDFKTRLSKKDLNRNLAFLTVYTEIYVIPNRRVNWNRDTDPFESKDVVGTWDYRVDEGVPSRLRMENRLLVQDVTGAILADRRYITEVSTVGVEATWTEVSDLDLSLSPAFEKLSEAVLAQLTGVLD